MMRLPLVFRLMDRRLIIGCLLAACYFPSPGYSQENTEQHSDNAITIELPAQPLNQTLTQLARQWQIAIAFNPEQLAKLNAPAIKGDYTLAELLEKLFEGSAYQARQQGNGWLISARPLAPKIVPAISPAPIAASSKAPIEDLLVLGNYSRNQQTAIQIKQQSNALVEAIIADDIAQFPAHNIAEAIQRSPGISVVRGRGEALFLSIRGLPTRFNSLSLNGQNLAVNENVRNSEQYGRRFHYDLFPAELVAGVEVFKSASADQSEGAIGGSVNLRTFAPLDMGDSKLSFSAKAANTELTDEWTPRLAGLGSWVNEEQSLGLLLAATYSDRESRQDRVLNFRWEQVGWEQVDRPDSSPLFTPAGLRPTLELEQRERTGLNLALQWQPSDAFSAGLNWLELQQTIDYQEFSYSADYQSQFLIPDSESVRDQALVAGDTNNGSVQIGRESAGISDENSLINGYFTWEGEIWNWAGNWASSRADSHNPDPIKRTRLRRLNDVSFAFHYPGDQQLPQIDYRNIDLQNPQDFPGRRLEWRLTSSEDDEDSLDFNIARAIHWGWFDGLKLGLQWRGHSRNYWRKDQLITEGISGQHFPASYFEPMPVTDFLAGKKVNNNALPNRWLIPNEAAFWQNVDEAAFYRAPLRTSDLLNSYRIDDDHYASYLKLDIHQPDWAWPVRGDLGLRYVRTDQLAQGYQPADDAVTPTNVRQTYDELLPSANLVLETRPDLLWRSSLARVMARPDYQDLAPRLSLNSGDFASASGGNPALKPVTGWQLDTAIEFYPAENGLLSAGAFYKKLDNFFQTSTRDALINGQMYELTQPDNGANARIAGIELALQTRLPEPLHHWGVETNYTRTWSRADYMTDTGTSRDRLADVASNSLNLGIYRESEHWDMRLHYSWRDRVLNQVASANLAAQNIDAFGSLDMHAAWHIHTGLSLTAEATNLTNAAQWESVLGDEFAGYTHYGRSLWLGIQLELL